ncbi:hypothetical protein FRC11_010334 [Ceratobasidium sp. 423]|nr:hypothetical protein FRC11_010334 [Ceratobasidium sp. 423]
MVEFQTRASGIGPAAVVMIKRETAQSRSRARWCYLARRRLALALYEPKRGTAPLPFTFAASKAPATNTTGGTVKVVESRTFNISQTIALAEVTIVPGGIRELHVSPLDPRRMSDSLDPLYALVASFFFQGGAQATVFASSGNARTFDHQAGGAGYVPPSFGHYVENIGNTTLKYLEIFKSDIYQDISLNQWLALTPPDMVNAHLQLSDEAISQLQKVNPVIVGPGEW